MPLVVLTRATCWALLCGAFLTGGCTSLPRATVGGTPTSTPVATEADPRFALLAGSWEYEEGSVSVELIMDDRGSGSYAYKGGRFETTSLVGYEWRGRWIQPGNDREGEFVVHLTDDFAEGEGRWWYTRIGTVAHPNEKGGLFHLMRNLPESSDSSASAPTSGSQP